MPTQLFKRARAIARIYEGPLCSHVDAFAKQQREAGYSPETMRAQLYVVAALSRWLAKRGWVARQLDEKKLNEFQRYRRRRGYVVNCPQACVQFLNQLREAGIVPQPKAERTRVSGRERVLEDFSRYLKHERALVDATVQNYRWTVRGFLTERFGDGPIRLGSLKSVDVIEYVRRHAERDGTFGVAQLRATALRGFLRYLFVRGRTRSNS